MKMNVTLSTVIATAVLAVATVTKSNSQPLTDIVINNVKIITDANNGMPANDGPVNNLQTSWPRVYKKLLATYKTFESLNYTVKGKKIYLNFKTNRQEVHSVYSVKGKINYAVTCLGKNLPATMAQRLKDEYPGYTVFFARHIKMQEGEVYHIVAENCSEYRVLNYAGEEFTEVKSIRK